MILTFLFLTVLIFLLVIHHKTWKAVAWPVSALKPPRFQGHRGYWKEGMKENTLSAFRAAAERGLTMIELDVRFCKGGIPVVFHDGNLKRLGGKDLQTDQVSAEDLYKWTGAPTLEEVLLASDIPQYINIEIKSNVIGNGDLEKAVAKLIKKHRAEERVLISSFNPVVLWRMRSYLPQVPRALLASKENEPGNHIYLKQLWLAPYLGIHALNLDYHYWSPEEVGIYKRRGIPVALWTVNDSELANRYLQAGALSVISDTLYEF